FFFFQAEDGIRDGHVTGVQTCALPISRTFRSKAVVESSNGNGELASVEEQLKRLTRPVRVSTLSAISGLSEATLRKKIEQGKLQIGRASCRERGENEMRSEAVKCKRRT